jgi:hypothetical protein
MARPNKATKKPTRRAAKRVAGAVEVVPKKTCPFQKLLGFLGQAANLVRMVSMIVGVTSSFQPNPNHAHLAPPPVHKIASSSQGQANRNSCAPVRNTARKSISHAKITSKAHANG